MTPEAFSAVSAVFVVQISPFLDAIGVSLLKGRDAMVFPGIKCKPERGEITADRPGARLNWPYPSGKMPSSDWAPPGPVMHVKFIWVGKTRSSSIQSLIEDYLERLRHLTSCEIVETRDRSRGRSHDGARRLAAEAAEIGKRLAAGTRVVVLDEGGTQFASPEFARWFEREQVRGTRELAFVVGGPDGIGPEVCRRADLRLSLGKMTWTHEMCRALLLEQVYRACSILRNIPYHK